jgi:hypothetical protein
VIKETTSADMRYLFTWNGLKGSGRSAQVDGFNVGGKTGTTDKVINGRYAKDINFNAFVAAFPMDKPKYIALSIIDATHRRERRADGRIHCRSHDQGDHRSDGTVARRATAVRVSGCTLPLVGLLGHRPELAGLNAKT